MKTRKLEYPSKVKDGKLTVLARRLFEQDVRDLPDGDYILTVKKAGKKTREQENFRWGVLYVEILKGLEDLGWRVKTRDDVHDIVKKLFLKKKIVNEKTGEEMELDGSSTELTVDEEIELQESLRLWASEYLGIDLSYPNDSHSLT